MGRKLIDLAGKKQGRLSVLQYEGVRNHSSQWLCKCDCGTVRLMSSTAIRNGAVSCGCYRSEAIAERNARHGHAKRSGRHPEYNLWQNMIRRCHNKRIPTFTYYGGRGIAVCDRWRFGDDSRTGFECFLLDMGERQSPGEQLDRIDNDLGYSPENCRWVTRIQNLRNKRGAIRVMYHGTDTTLAEAAEAAGVSYDRAWHRLRAGWPVDDALTPARKVVRA